MKNDIVTIAADLIRVPSVADNAKAHSEVLSVAKKYLKGFDSKGYEKDGIQSLLFYNQQSVPDEFTVILNAHLDVVPANVNQFVVHVDGDRLYGRGAYDMKGAAAAEIMAFAAVARQVKYPLGLQLVTDEEVGGFKGTKYQVEKGVKTKFALVGESSSDFSLGIRAKGILWIHIRFTGKSAHGAYPWNGENALWKVQKFLTAVWDKYPIPQKETWQTTVNVASIETSNRTYNKVPDEAILKLDIRYIPEEGMKTVENAIMSFIPHGSIVEVVARESAHMTDAQNPFVQQLAKTASQLLGKESKIVSKHGASDLRHFPDTAGVEFGPVGEGPHTDNEWVSISGLEAYYRILCDFLLSVQ